jgi:uncharacterized protein (TIGR02145 family)
MRHKNFKISILLILYLGVIGVKAQTVKDIDGNVYKTVTIYTQVWMAENLRTTKYNNGQSIPMVIDDTVWSNLNTPGYWCYKDSAYAQTYGALYNWYTVNTGKLCPTGWHVPTDYEWTTLTLYIGGESVAGGKLKETGTTHWVSPNNGATNETGFTALPGGARFYDGRLDGLGRQGYWWSATLSHTDFAFFRLISYWGGNLISFENNVKFGYSVRCVKD